MAMGHSQRPSLIDHQNVMHKLSPSQIQTHGAAIPACRCIAASMEQEIKEDLHVNRDRRRRIS